MGLLYRGLISEGLISGLNKCFRMSRYEINQNSIMGQY